MPRNPDDAARLRALRRDIARTWPASNAAWSCAAASRSAP